MIDVQCVTLSQVKKTERKKEGRSESASSIPSGAEASPEGDQGRKSAEAKPGECACAVGRSSDSPK
jgi:hypothetical protein